MNKTSLAAVSLIALISLCTTAQAQFPQLPRVPGLPSGGGSLPRLPGTGGSGAASYDPDAFVYETVQTTKLMMVSAALLAAAADSKSDADAVRARIKAIEGINEVGELKSQKKAFNSDMGAIKTNAGDAQAAEALYDRSDAKSRKLLSAAAYNFALAMLRNTVLAGQAPDLIRNVSSSPAMMMKVGSLKTAGDLAVQQAKAVGSMSGPMQTLMSRGGVKAPTDARSSKPKPVSI